MRTKDAPGPNLPNLDDVKRRGAAEPKAAPPIPSKRRKCPPDDPNCHAPLRASLPGEPSTLARTSPSLSLLGAAVGFNPYAGVLLASYDGAVPPQARGVDVDTLVATPPGWLHAIKNLFGLGAPRVSPGGVFETATCDYVSGWAWDAGQPNTPVMVALFDGTQFVASALADRYRADLVTDGKGDGRHGFLIPLPNSLRNGVGHNLSVYIQGVGQGLGYPLGSSPRTVSCPAPVYAGEVTSADCEQVTGWAWDIQRPSTPIEVDVYVDGVFRARASADVYNAQLNKGDNRHQFRIPTPVAARDGQPHTVTLRPADSTQDLHSVPAGGCAGPSYYGPIDGADCSYLYGWAWDSNQRNSPVGVDLYADGQFVTTALADVFRPGLLSAGFGDGRHGFVIPLPDSLRDGVTHTLTARVAGGGPPLYGSAPVTCQAQAGACGPDRDLASPESVKDFYRGALARQPRAAELQYWNDALRTASGQGQTTLIAEARRLGRELFRQGEYANRGRMAPAQEEAYVSDLFWAYMQRGPNSGGLSYWADRIREENAQGQNGWLNTLVAFEASGEFLQRVAAVCPSPSQSAGGYSATNDFSPLQNPNAAWSYGYRPAGARSHPSTATPASSAPAWTPGRRPRAARRSRATTPARLTPAPA